MADTIVFERDSVTMSGIRYQAEYSVTPSGKVFVFAELDGEKLRLEIGRDDAFYADALRAAAPERLDAGIRADLERIDAEAAAERRARAEERAAHKAERAAARTVQPDASSAASVAAPVDKPWVGTAIKGKGWEIELGCGYDKIRVIFKKPPCAGIKELVREFGFYYSPSLKSWNRGVTCKGFRAAEKLAAHLRYYPEKPLFA